MRASRGKLSRRPLPLLSQRGQLVLKPLHLGPPASKRRHETGEQDGQDRHDRAQQRQGPPPLRPLPAEPREHQDGSGCCDRQRRGPLHGSQPPPHLCPAGLLGLDLAHDLPEGLKGFPERHEGSRTGKALHQPPPGLLRLAPGASRPRQLLFGPLRLCEQLPARRASIRLHQVEPGGRQLVKDGEASPPLLPDAFQAPPEVQELPPRQGRLFQVVQGPAGPGQGRFTLKPGQLQGLQLLFEALSPPAKLSRLLEEAFCLGQVGQEVFQPLEPFAELGGRCGQLREARQALLRPGHLLLPLAAASRPRFSRFTSAALSRTASRCRRHCSKAARLFRVVASLALSCSRSAESCADSSCIARSSSTAFWLAATACWSSAICLSISSSRPSFCPSRGVSPRWPVRRVALWRARPGASALPCGCHAAPAPRAATAAPR